MRQINVLLVDDEPAILRGITAALSKEPYHFSTAHSAEQALTLMNDTLYDVVVTDEKMPGMSGSDLLAKVREMHPEAIRIIITGKASAESAMKAIYDGMVYQYLQKPFKPSDLSRVINEALLQKGLISRSQDTLMPANEQIKLLESFSGSSENESDDRKNGGQSGEVDKMRWIVDEVYFALKKAANMHSADDFFAKMRAVLDEIEQKAQKQS